MPAYAGYATFAYHRFLPSGILRVDGPDLCAYWHMLFAQFLKQDDEVITAWDRADHLYAADGRLDC